MNALSNSIIAVFGSVGNTIFDNSIRDGGRSLKPCDLKAINDFVCFAVSHADNLGLSVFLFRCLLYFAIRKVLGGAPGGIRTPGLWYRKPTLYPAELRVRMRSI